MQKGGEEETTARREGGIWDQGRAFRGKGPHFHGAETGGVLGKRVEQDQEGK